MIKTAIAFATGCILILLMPTLPVINWFWLALLNIFLFLFTPTRYLAITLTAALWTIWQCQNILGNQLGPEHYNKNVTVIGTIASVPEAQSRTVRFDFIPKDNEALNLPHKLRLSWYRPYPKELSAGQKWQLNVKLKPPFGMMNPGGFDYEGWLFQHDIGATGYVKKSDNNIKLADPNPWHLNAFRQTLAHKIKQHLPSSENVGLIQGLLVGIKHNITHEQWQILRQSGTSHLLAISGLHIGLAATIGFYLFSLLWSIRSNHLIWLPAKQVGAIGAISLAFIYAALAGFSIPTQRAFIMVFVFMIALIIRKTIRNSQLLAIAALIILIINPIAVISPGFWLSFFAVTIILFISQHRFPTPKFQWARVHVFIAFGLTPLLLLFFSQTSLIAPIANIFAVPFVSLVIVPLLLLTSVLSLLWPMASHIGFSLIDNLFQVLIEGLSTLAVLPYSNWDITLPAPLALISLILATSLLLLPKGIPGKNFAVLGFLPLFLPSNNPIKHDEFNLTLLDVGQGLSAVIQTQHHTLVFDTGAKFSEKFNAGEVVLVPFLKKKGIDHIDTLIISHSDNDHAGGAKSLLSEIAATTILTSQLNALPNAEQCLAGHTWYWDNIHFELLNPRDNQTGSDNNLSCVLRVSNQEHSVLLTGDIEKRSEQKLIQHYPKKLASTVLIAPHHGSETSSTQAFINAVMPKIVLFPAGYLNRYHFPNKVVLKRYSEKGSEIYSTAKSGAISVHFQPRQKPKITTWRQQGKRIWTTVPTD
jgi:competence protein ComEC